MNKARLISLMVSLSVMAWARVPVAILSFASTKTFNSLSF